MAAREFDPTNLRSAAKDLLRLADDLDDQIDAFLHETGAIGEVCRDAEPIGMLLGPSCGTAEDVVVEALESVVAGFETFAEDLRTLADRDAATEQDNERTIRALEM